MRALSDQQAGGLLGDLNGLDALLHGLQGPPPHYPHRTYESDISLSDGSGRFQSDWDSDTRSFFPDRNIQPGYFAPEQSQAEVYGQGNAHDNLATDLISEGPSMKSDDPLMGRQ